MSNEVVYCKRKQQMLFRAWDSPKEKSLDIAVSKLFYCKFK